MADVIGLGAGGHAKVVIEILKLENQHNVAGLLDQDSAKIGTEVLGVPVLGTDELLPELFARGIRSAFIGLGTLGFSRRRRDLYVHLLASEFQVVSAIHPTATVSKFAEVGNGVTITAGAVVNPGSKLGDNVIINTGAIIDHDCIVGTHAHVATGACLAGGVRIGTCAHVGIGAVVRQGISIGAGAVVGAGSVVVKDVPDNVVVMGVPASFYKRVES